MILQPFRSAARNARPMAWRSSLRCGAYYCLAMWMGSGIAVAVHPVSVADFDERIKPLLQTHCGDCHIGSSVEAGVDFGKFTSTAVILGETDLWRRVREALEHQHMPPDPEQTEFTAVDRRLLVDWIEDAVETIDLESEVFRHPGPAFIRQLTPYEYMRTVEDLLSMDEIPFGRLGIAQEYPQEGLEYVNQALGLTLSPADFDRYLRTGEEVLKQFFGDETGIWRQTGSAHRGYRKAAEAARPKVLSLAGDGQAAADSKSREEVEVAEQERAAQILSRFAAHAFRRPLRPGESDELMSIYQQSQDLGGSHEDSLRAALASVLASPYFLLRIEEDQAPPKSEAVYPVKPHELATRLSYFLWSSMPDDRLRQQADSGELINDEVLETEIERMLVDPKGRALTDHFAQQWLQLRLMDLPSLPDRRGFPKLTSDLQKAFRQELLTFFDRMRTEDHNILDFLDSQYTYVDRELASFYGLSDAAAKQAKKGEVVRVSLRPEDHRGGLLGMGGILWMTSHESRTKPTARGK